MSDGQEFYAATVDEAVDKASAVLGVPRDRLDFEVQDEGSRGFLGIGARDARILVEHSELNAGVPSLGEENLPLECSGERQAHPVEEEPHEAVQLVEDSDLVAEDA